MGSVVDRFARPQVRRSDGENQFLRVVDVRVSASNADAPRAVEGEDADGLTGTPHREDPLAFGFHVELVSIEHHRLWASRLLSCARGGPA